MGRNGKNGQAGLGSLSEAEGGGECRIESRFVGGDGEQVVSLDACTDDRSVQQLF